MRQRLCSIKRVNAIRGSDVRSLQGEEQKDGISGDN
jgi:hypothetical protein